jgi:hypothetical protein
MAFCRNIAQQMNMSDPLYQLSEREKKYLTNSWAETFSTLVFPLINEERFSVLYSNNHASRPNNPVNVYLGLLMLKEIFGQSDEEAIESLLFDIRYQYALHTTSFKEQPVSKNSLTNFRTAVYAYNEEHGTDLIKEEFESHAKEFSKILNINGRTFRMDSLMVSSSCKKLSRLEIIYSCVFRLIEEINKTYSDLLPTHMKVYLEEGHRNDTIYRSRDKDLDSKLQKLITDAIELFYLCKDHPVSETKDYQLLSRMISDQTTNNDGNFELKPGSDISSESLQNPTDPDATNRKKGNKSYTGYTGNVVENFDGENAIIEQYALEQNIHSDQEFSKEVINSMGKQPDKVIMTVDGAYYSEDIKNQAAENNIEIIPTALTGPIPNKLEGLTGITIDTETNLIIQCLNLQQPIFSQYKDGIYQASFTKEQCANCPHKEQCPIIEQKKSNLLKVSEAKLNRANLIIQMNTKEYQEIANKRAGVEGIPSVLRRRYNVDHLPVRGLVRSKMWFGLKISAINFKRLLKGLEQQANLFLPNRFPSHFTKLFNTQRSLPKFIAA